MITLVVTSCGRWDLLERTLKSFFRYEGFNTERMILTEDGGEGIPEPVMTRIMRTVPRQCQLSTICPTRRVGQIASIDRAYALVKTPYVFHLEEDWEFHRTGFMAESLDVLESDPQCVNLWLRERDDTNGHPVKGDRMVPGYKGEWHGFTFNPTLKRMSDYKKLGSYYAAAPFRPEYTDDAEARIGERYKDMGMYARIAERGYVRHIGDGRRVERIKLGQ